MKIAWRERESLQGRQQAKRLYGRSLIRRGQVDIARAVLALSLLSLPILAISLNVTCTRHARVGASDPYWNDIARYLAGMEVSGKSVLRQKTTTAHYQYHRRFMDDLWSRIQKETLDLVIPWRKKNVPTLYFRATAFYPLSGADFINLYALFPHARRYLMIAMEPEGDVSVLRDHQSWRLVNGLVPIQRSIYAYGVNNYFQSKIMAEEMTNTLLPGTAPALLIFLARLGLTVKAVDNVFIDESGRLAPAAGLDASRSPGKVTGLRIGFRGRDGSSRELVYLRMRISSASVHPDTPEGKYLNRLRGVKTLLKSAVYLLHLSTFGPVRDFILDRSALIVQDDSGIPYRFFTDGWKTSLYGIYRPAMNLGNCVPVFQNDLMKRYAESADPLPFNFGYGILFGHGQSNLMVARKK